MNKRTHDKDFSLSSNLRDYFEGVGGTASRYEAAPPSFQRIAPRTNRGSKYADYSDPNLRRLYEKNPNNSDKESLIYCNACGGTTLHGKPILQCDFCPCAFHLDCTDPIMANPPFQACLTANSSTADQFKFWMCPNHTYHDLAYLVHDEEGYDHRRRIRTVKRPRLVDIEVLPDSDDEEAKMREITHEGEKYRVSERGVKLSFIEKVKRYVFFFFFASLLSGLFSLTCNRDHIESEAKKAAAERYFAYAKQQFDKLTAGARELYENQRVLTTPMEGTATEHDAALSLLSLSHGNSESADAVQSELETLRSLQLSIGSRIQRLGMPHPRVQEIEDDDDKVQNGQDGKDGQDRQKSQETQVTQETQEVEMAEDAQEV